VNVLTHNTRYRS